MATNQPLTFTAEQANSTIQLKKNGNATVVSLEYSTDGGVNWSSFSVDTTYTLASVGDTIQIRATSTNPNGMAQSSSNYHKFMMTGKFAASGNIMSLYDVDFATKDIAMTPQGFHNLFLGCASLTQAPELPAMTLADNCYDAMFRECSALKVAPKLPATTVVYGCYAGMFYLCTSLMKAPELPATNTANYCYTYMFYQCSALSSVASAISSKTLNYGGSATANWLSGVASDGTFYYTNPDFDPSSITQRTSSTVPTGWTIEAAPSSSSDFHLMGKLVKELFIQGRRVKTLFINGKRAL